MGNVRGTRRGGDAPGKVKVVIPPAIPSGQLPMEYCAREDPLSPGVWRAEPVNYDGRGYIAFFRGEFAKYEAIAFVKKKNKRDGFA